MLRRCLKSNTARSATQPSHGNRSAREAVQGSMTAPHKHLKSSEVPPPFPSDILATATSNLTCAVQSSTDRCAEQRSQRWQRAAPQLWQRNDKTEPQMSSALLCGI